MSYIEDKLIYYINSANRVSGTHSNFVYKLDIPPNKLYTHVTLLDLSIPKSYYLIQEPRNTFILKEENKEVTITVPPGNYSSNTFSKYITQEMNNKSPNQFHYYITQNNQGKYEFEVKNNDNIQPSIKVSNYLYEQLGFEPETENKFVNNKLTSTNVIDFQRESTLFLRSDIVGHDNNNNVLQQVFTENTADYSNIVFINNDIQAYAKRLNTNTTNAYRFILTDENGQYIDTNGRNLVFTLLIYKQSTANENLKAFIETTYKFLQDYRNKILRF
jgi:hypothetical protein